MIFFLRAGINTLYKQFPSVQLISLGPARGFMSQSAHRRAQKNTGHEHRRAQAVYYGQPQSKPRQRSSKTQRRSVRRGLRTSRRELQVHGSKYGNHRRSSRRHGQHLVAPTRRNLCSLEGGGWWDDALKAAALRASVAADAALWQELALVT